jgi:amino acid transporter
MVPAIIIVYILVSVSVFVFYRRQHRSEFSWLKHGLFPVLAIAAMALPLKSVVWPVPPMPYVLAPYIVAGWIILGLIWMAILRRRNPEALSGSTAVWDTD